MRVTLSTRGSLARDVMKGALHPGVTCCTYPSASLLVCLFSALGGYTPLEGADGVNGYILGGVLTKMMIERHFVISFPPGKTIIDPVHSL